MPETVTGLGGPEHVALVPGLDPGLSVLAGTMGHMNIMLFHSTYGLRPAVRAAADRLRAAGHEVWMLDLFEGRTFETVEEGMAFNDGIGKEELLRRAVLAAAPYSSAAWCTRGSRSAPPSRRPWRSATRRPLGCCSCTARRTSPRARRWTRPVELHVAEPDPFENCNDRPSAWYLQMQRAGADVEIYRYAGAGHLYTDPDLPDYDEEAAEATWRVALGFLDSL